MPFEYREESGHTEDLEADDMDEAEGMAEDLLRNGSWDEEGGWVSAVVTEYDDDGEEVNFRNVNVLLEPKEPDCAEEEHDWTLDGEGGLKENLGVWSIDNGAILTRSHCRNCNVICETISGDCNPPQCGNRDGVTYKLPTDD